MPAPIVVADSITRVEPDSAGAVIVNASHGGVYAAYLAAKLRAAAAIFNDAGVGCDRAGIGGLDYLDEFGIAAATVGHDTARIGDGADMMASGVITHANGIAASLGVLPGQSCRAAATALQQARPTHRAPPEALEGAFLLITDPPSVWACSICVTRPARAQGLDRSYRLAWRTAWWQARHRAQVRDVLGALYNDAGIGKDAAGTSRLPALDARGIAAATVSSVSARIGDARSTYEDGIISRVNVRAASLGLREGISAREFVAVLRRALAAQRRKP